MSYGSYNAYLFQTNLKIALSIFAAHCFISKLGFTFHQSNFFEGIEAIIILRCIYNMWFCTKHITTPFILSIDTPWSKYIFVRGPLTRSIINFFNKIFKRTSTAPVVAPPVALEKKISVMEAFQKAQEMFPAVPFNANLVPTIATMKRPVNEIKEQEKLLKEQIYGTMTAKDIDQPKLRFVPCLPPARKPIVKKDRSLWHLARTPKLVEEFKMEQLEEYHDNWNKFNDEKSRVHYHRLTAALLKHIFKPLDKSIESFEAILSNSSQSIATVDPKFLAFTLLLPEFNNEEEFPFSPTEISKMVTVNHREDVASKNYVVNRIKELANSQRMAAFRGIPKEAGMPSDSEIVFYIVRTYLRTRELHVVPPLLPLEGDVFKFLLIYVKMTPELSWNVF